jgi:hypothetical protein
MLEQLQQIDTSVIDELMEIKSERETIGERVAKMTQDQGKVSDVVYRRVRRDYESRLSALERKAAPLKDRARQEYAKLKSLFDRLENAHQATKLDREEIDFRHKLGEFDDGEFKQKTGELDDKLDRQAAELEEAGAVREQFLGAFDSEQDLALPAASAPPAPAPPPPDAGITAPQPVIAPPPGPAPMVTAEVAMATPPPPGSGPRPGGPNAPAAEGTVILGSEAPAPVVAGATIIQPPAPPSAPAPPPSPSPGTPPAAGSGPVGKTVVLTRGKLIAIDTDLGASEFSLEPLTFIGRTPENQIRLNKPAVSRRHAQIAQSEGGYVLRDLNSENGTYVNGEKVKDRPLADGDRVQIGTVRFVFRAG